MAADSEFCISCGAPDRLEPVELLNPGAPDDDGLFRYKVKCFKCGGKQDYLSDREDLIKPPEEPIIGNAGLEPGLTVEGAAASGKSLNADAGPPPAGE
jgi:hypothetical protein